MENERNETLTVNGIEYVSLSVYADTNDMDVKHLRRYVRKSKTSHARKWGTMWLIERDAQITLPETSPRGKSRDDGRQRFVVYMTAPEHDTMLVANIVPVDCIVNPRIAAAARRIANNTE